MDISLITVKSSLSRETQMKKNVTFNSDGTVTYGDVRKHEFDPIESKGSPNDTLVVPNLALIVSSMPTWFFLIA